MIVIAQDLVATLQETEAANSPLIGWHNIVATDNVSESSAAAGFPVTELANPATDLYWLAADTGAQSLTVTTNTADDLDYVAIAGHNLATAEVAISIEGDDGGGFDELIAPVMLADDRPAIFRFPRQPLQSVRVVLASGAAPASIAVLRLGALIVVPRKIGVGHIPINYAREANVITGMSENGRYLGAVQVGETNKSAIEFRNLSPTWYRETLDPVIASRRPFFWAWRPTTYPLEVGYVWPVGNPKPNNQRANGMMAIGVPVEGEA